MQPATLQRPSWRSTVAVTKRPRSSLQRNIAQLCRIFSMAWTDDEAPPNLYVFRSLQIRSVFLSLFNSRRATPRSNFRMIPANQHLWHFPSAIFRRPRVMRKIQQQGRCCRAEGAPFWIFEGGDANVG